MNFRNKLVCGAALLAIAYPGGLLAAAAQETVDAEAVASDYAVSRQATITVTAQKREQSLQDVAGSVTALAGETVEALGLTSVQELAMQVPGLDFGQTNGGTFISLRGVTLNVDTGVAEPNIAIHQDGLFLPRSTMGMLDYTDVERVEVLRGPQGTLYGRNATGGAINFISKAPGSDSAAEVKLGYGSFDTLTARGTVSGPLSEKLGGRLSVAYDRRGEGYADNEFTGGTFDTSELFNVRGAFALEISDRIRADASIQYQDETFQTYQQLMEPQSAIAPILFPALATASVPSSPWTIGNDYNPDSKRSTLIGRLGVEFDLTPDISLKSITGYIDHEFENRIDGDGTSAAILAIEDRTQPSRSYSQEFNLSGTFGARGNWLLGAYVFNEEFESNIPITLASGFAGLGLPPNAMLVSNLAEDTLSYAVFADATLSATDRLRVYGGLRLSRDEKEFVQTAGALIPGLPSSLTLGCDDVRSKRTYESSNPRIGFQYDFAESVMGYIQYSRGYKSGGLNSSTCGNFYNPEQLDSIEAGIKSTALDGRLVLNASVYNYRYDDFQVFKYNVGSALIENASARNIGGEIESRLLLGEDWQIDGALTYTDTEITDYLSSDPSRPGTGVLDLKGGNLPRSPEWTANLGVQNRFGVSVGPFSNLLLRADAKFSDSFLLRPYGVPQDVQEAYVLANATAILATEDQSMRIRAFVRNIGDESVISHKFYSGLPGAWYGNYLPPRTWGFEVIKSF